MAPEESNENLDWDIIASKVLVALRRRIGKGPGLLEAERFVSSAIRTALRQMQAGDLAPMLPEQLVGWLIQVARRKYIDAVRHTEVERRHQGAVAKPHANVAPGRLAQEAAEEQEAAQEVVREFVEQATPEERIILEGKLADKTQAEIADEVAKLPHRKGKCSQATVSNIWRALCERWKTRAEGTEEAP